MQVLSSTPFGVAGSMSFTPRFTRGYQCLTPFGVVQNLPIFKLYIDYADKPYLFFSIKVIILSAAPTNIIAQTHFFRF